MRNFVIHVYFGIDLPLVWKTIKANLPPVKAQLQEILKENRTD